MIEYNKTVFYNSLSAMNLVYDQNKKMIETFLNQATWLPQEGKRATSDWMVAYRKGCDDFKKLVDDSYAKVEAYFENY